MSSAIAATDAAEELSEILADSLEVVSIRAMLARILGPGMRRSN